MRKITLLPFAMLVLAACGVTTPSSSEASSTPASSASSASSTVTTSTSTTTSTSVPSSSEDPGSSFISIQAARALTNETEATIRGVVTRVTRQRNFYVQDGDFGITVFGYDGTEVVEEGDYVEVYGFIGNYNGLIQLTGAAGTGVPAVTQLTGQAPTITPLVLNEQTFDDATLKQDNDGRLVRVNKLSLAGPWVPLLEDAAYPSGGGVNVTMNLGAKTLTARFDRYINVTDRAALNSFFGGLTAGQKVDYEGILGEFNSIQLAVSNATDFTLNTDAPVLPTSLTVTAPATPAEVVENLTLQLSADVLPADADDKSVTWASDDDAIATVSPTGLVTGVAPGTATITATSVAASLVSGTLQVTVTPAPLELSGVQFGVGDSTLKVGATLDSDAGLLPLGYVGQGITYSSSDDAVATVTSAGLIQARSVGTATITAAATEDATVTDTVEITVEDVMAIADAKVAVANTMVTVNGVITKIMATNEFYIQNATEAVQVLGPSASLSTALFSEGDFVQVSGPAINSSTPRRIGTTNLPSGTTLSVEKIDFLTAPEVTPLVVTESTYNVTDTPITNQWRLVQMDGLTPPQPWVPVVSTSTINRTFKLGQADVTARISQFILADEITAINALFADFWKNDTVNYNGILSVFQGNLQILPSGAKDFTLVEADPVPVTSIVVSTPNDVTELVKDSTLQLTSVVNPSNADDLTVTYESSAPSVATVSSTGLVTGLTTGNVTITVTSVMTPSVSNTIQLSVIEPPTLLGITLSASRLEIGLNGESQISITNDPLTFVGTFTYESGSPAVASVSNTGLVTGVSAGSAVITVTSVEFSLISETITIIVTSTLEYKNTETFNFGSSLTTSYATNLDGALSSSGSTWLWADSRNADPLRDGAGAMLRYDKSFFETTVTGGVSSFSIEFSKAFTGTGARQLLVRFTDGVTTKEFTGEEFGTVSGADTAIRTLAEAGINLEGTVTITITQNFPPSTTSRQTNIYNFKWNGYVA